MVDPEARPMVGGAVAVDDDQEVAAALFRLVLPQMLQNVRSPGHAFRNDLGPHIVLQYLV